MMLVSYEAESESTGLSKPELAIMIETMYGLRLDTTFDYLEANPG